MRSISKSSVLRLSTYAKVTAHRLSTISLIIIACLLLLIDKIDNSNVEYVKGLFIDLSAKAINITGKPAASFTSGVESFFSLMNIYNNNKELEQENANLRIWKNKAETLQIENDKLRQLLDSIKETNYSYVTAKVISTSGGSFLKTVTINAGKNNGIKIGNAVVNVSGMIGRIVEVGNSAARVLLVTDLNSQIPVVTEQSGYKAILAGDNSPLLFLKFLHAHSVIKNGERLITSGDGGILPSGLVVGKITDSSKAQKPIVMPVRDWDKLDFIRIIKFDSNLTLSNVN